MCGIAGIVSENLQEVSLQRLKQMTDSIKHRGPDGEGQWLSEDNKVGLGHRRLSIIDLSEQAGQPMHYLDRYTITFNGEIYNYLEIKEQLSKEGYVFRTTSDTEVLMALYDRDKEKCLLQLDGMFSFALYDKKEHILFCARDRFGEKPLHYHLEDGKCFIFGSEMKELWAAGVSKTINQRMMYNYLRQGFLQNPNDQSETFYSQIHRLEPAHYLIVNTQTVHVKKKKYWDLNLSLTSTMSIDDASIRFKELFFTSISRRLRSDVPVGSSLSGGLDSSAVVCAIDALNVDKRFQQKTFSAQFPGFEKDESHFQQMVIAQTKAEAYYTYPDADIMLSELDKVFACQEEPFGSASILAQYEVFKLAKQHKVTVLLDGQGADEVLAGYHPYFMYYFLELEKNKKELNHQMKAYAQLHGNNSVNGLYRKDLRYHLRHKLPFAFDSMRKIKNIFSENQKAFTRDFYHEYKKDSFQHPSKFYSLNESLYSTLMNGPMQDLLRYADRNSMCHSLEVRLPFLNHELVEFIYSLPATFKINEGWTKYIMRHALNGILPKEIAWRVDKIGYEPPQKKWMNRSEVKERILESKKVLVKSGILTKEEGEKEIVAEQANAQGLSNWNCWMAGKLLDSSLNTVNTQ